MKNDEFLQDLNTACQAVLREGLKTLRPEIVALVHALLASGQADMQIITVMGAAGLPCVMGALTQKNEEPLVLFKIDLPRTDTSGVSH